MTKVKRSSGEELYQIATRIPADVARTFNDLYCKPHGRSMSSGIAILITEIVIGEQNLDRKKYWEGKVSVRDAAKNGRAA